MSFFLIAQREHAYSVIVQMANVSLLCKVCWVKVTVVVIRCFL